MCSSMVKRPSEPHGFANGRNKLSWTLQLPKLSNYMYLSDALQISIIRTVWACRCATTWSFALRTHMGVSMGAINFWNPLSYRLSYIAYRPYMMLLHCLQLLAESLIDWLNCSLSIFPSVILFVRIDHVLLRKMHEVREDESRYMGLCNISP